MRDFHVFIEQQGEQIYVGKITGSGSEDAIFTYAQEYLDNPSSCPISIHLPLQAQNFSAEETSLFFEGLLPEGFTRKCVAGWIHADEYDYLTILAALGGNVWVLFRLLKMAWMSQKLVIRNLQGKMYADWRKKVLQKRQSWLQKRICL